MRCNAAAVLQSDVVQHQTLYRRTRNGDRHADEPAERGADPVHGFQLQPREQHQQVFRIRRHGVVHRVREPGRVAASGDVNADHSIAVASHLARQEVEVTGATGEAVNADEGFRVPLAPFEVGQMARARDLRLCAAERLSHLAGRSHQRRRRSGTQRASSPNETKARPPFSGRSTLRSFSERRLAARTGNP